MRFTEGIIYDIIVSVQNGCLHFAGKIIAGSVYSLARYVINGGKTLQGTVTISGAKNAALAILPAVLLVDGQCRIENVPDISDVHILLDILKNMGAEVTEEGSVVTIDCSPVRSTCPDAALVRKMRAS